MEGNEQLAVIIPMLDQISRGIGPADLTRPTPCDDFDVAGVLAHMTGLATVFAPVFSGEEPEAAPTGVGPTEGFRIAMHRLLDAVSHPDALEGDVETPMGTMPSGVFARMVALDGMLHGWDLATATDQAWHPSDALVEEVHGFALQALVDENRGDSFGPATTPTAAATPMERLACFSGRA